VVGQNHVCGSVLLHPAGTSTSTRVLVLVLVLVLIPASTIMPLQINLRQWRTALPLSAVPERCHFDVCMRKRE
jgi:hypothetical protein